MEDPKIVQRNLALQREWYGEPLGDRVRRLVRAFNISQATLADAIGISAPMLSQVMSGRRAKIGNPSVLAKLIMLERKVFVPDVAAGKPEAIKAALLDIRDSRPTVGRDVLTVDGSSDANAAVAALRNILAAEDLIGAAELVDSEYPELADLLRRAGERTSGERPSGERPSGERPNAERSGGDRAASDRSANDRPASERVTGERPGEPAPSNVAAGNAVPERPVVTPPLGTARPAGLPQPAGPRPSVDGPGIGPAPTRPAGATGRPF